MFDYLNEKEKAFVLALAWGKQPERAAITAAMAHSDWPEKAQNFLDREVVRRAIRALCNSRPNLALSMVFEGNQVRPESEIPEEFRPHIKVTRTKRGRGTRVEFTNPVHIASLLHLIPFAPVGA